MNKILLWVIIILAVLAGGWYWYAGQPQQSMRAQLNADIYPLYSSATWETAVATTSPEYGQVVQVQSAPFADTTNIAAISTPFTQYYNDKLTAAGWTQDMSREAGGPGAEVSFYTKGDQFVKVSFHSVFKVNNPDAPSECPCDVSFTLVSGTQTSPTPAEVLALKTYHDTGLGFSLTLPTALASGKSDTLYSVDTAYEYTAQGPGRSIAGVKFTIPASEAAVTNLSSDSYISVEHLPAGKVCDAVA